MRHAWNATLTIPSQTPPPPRYTHATKTAQVSTRHACAALRGRGWGLSRDIPRGGRARDRLRLVGEAIPVNHTCNERAPIPPHRRARAAPAAFPRVDRAERRVKAARERAQTRYRMRGRARRRARSRRCEGRQTRSSERPPFELPSATLAAHGPQRPTHAPAERSGDDNPAVWRGEDARVGLGAACGLDGEVQITKKLTLKGR